MRNRILLLAVLAVAFPASAQAGQNRLMPSDAKRAIEKVMPSETALMHAAGSSVIGCRIARKSVAKCRVKFEFDGNLPFVGGSGDLYAQYVLRGKRCSPILVEPENFKETYRVSGCAV